MEIQDLLMLVLLVIGGIAIYTMITGMEKTDGYTPQKLALPERVPARRSKRKKRPYTKRSKYWGSKSMRAKIEKARATKKAKAH